MSTITVATLAAKTPTRAAAADTVRTRLRGILDGLRVELDAAGGVCTWDSRDGGEP